jgi:hypothetical protein
MTLSANKKTLSGEFKYWRNVHVDGFPGFFGSPPIPEDAFVDDDPLDEHTVALSVSDTGQATYQSKLKGKPVGSMPPWPLNAIYENGLFVEKSTTGVKSLSFTLGITH